MSLFRGRLLLLGAAAALLLARCFGSSSHSLLYLHTAISERGCGSPQFSALAYMDDQLFGRYDRDTKQCLPQSSWIEEFIRDDALFWSRSTSGDFEMQLITELGVFKNLYNRSQGLHVLQMMFGCELTKDDHARGFMKYGYNGRGFLSLDQKTLTWTALEAEAKLIKQKWDAEPSRRKFWKHFVQETCVDWLHAHLHYGKAALLRNVPPTVKVARKEHQDGQETLVCWAYGFYPKEIEVNWTKDGMDHMQDTFTGGVVPNMDRTYHKWLSIDVDPKDRDRFRCHVEHDGLEKPLDLAWEEPASSVSVGLIVGVLVGVLLVAAALVVGVVIYYIQKRNRPVGGYQATPGSPPGSKDSDDNLSQGSKDSNVSSPLGSIHSTDILLPEKNQVLCRTPAGTSAGELEWTLSLGVSQN